MSVRHESVVIGGGVIGSAIGYYLTLKGIGARIVEACGVAGAASWKSGRFLASDWTLASDCT